MLWFTVSRQLDQNNAPGEDNIIPGAIAFLEGQDRTLNHLCNKEISR